AQNDAEGNPVNPQQALLNISIPDCPWIDGFDKQIRIIPAQLPRVKQCALAYRDNAARYSLAERQQPPQGLFDRFIFQGGELQFYTTPLVLRNEMTEAASAALQQRTKDSKRAMAEALHFFSNPIYQLPSIDELVNATQSVPLDWRPEIRRGDTQTLESFQEQQVALDLGLQAIDLFCSGQRAFIPAPVLLGPPGSGKSHVTAHWGAYALAKGLNTIVTSVASERAAALGGEHIHLVFSIPVASSPSSRILAERALTRLARDPVKMQWLKSIR
ncbi:hypothetical protein FOL47_003131, partial [Perkinsus chesapeaki]